MLESILNGGTVTFAGFALCALVSLALGAGAAWAYMYGNRGYTKGFVVTVALLPVMVQLVIMLVNGNIGTGIAVMGAFSLVRFRSAPGGAREIGAIFLATAIGLATGTGYLAIAALFTVLVCAAGMALMATHFGDMPDDARELRVSVPENLEFEGLFDDLFSAYCKSCALEKVRTAGMGSLYELIYNVRLRENASSRELIDQIRTRNGNLTVSLGHPRAAREEL